MKKQYITISKSAMNAFKNLIKNSKNSKLPTHKKVKKKSIKKPIELDFPKDLIKGEIDIGCIPHLSGGITKKIISKAREHGDSFTILEFVKLINTAKRHSRIARANNAQENLEKIPNIKERYYCKTCHRYFKKEVTDLKKHAYNIHKRKGFPEIEFRAYTTINGKDLTEFSPEEIYKIRNKK